MNATNEERIPTTSILIYSSPVLGVFMAGMLVNFYLLKFSTDILLIAPATIGFLLLVARVWDAVTDPAAGWLSDRTNTILGRRRPWFLGSALPLGGSIVMLWSPPESLTGSALTIWIGVAILFFYTAYTAFRVPHIAMGAELSRGYHDRTRVFGIMQMVESTGMLAAAGVLIFLEGAEDPRAFARYLSVAIAVFSTVLIVVAAWRLRERSEFLGRGGANPWKSFGDVLSNPHARILIGVFFLEQLGFSALVALVPYMSDYILNTPGNTGIYLFGAIGTTLVSIPLWINLSRRFGKMPVWMFSILAKCVLFAMIFFLGEGDIILMIVVSVGFGLMNGCGAVVGPSLKADVVDWDEGATGERKEGSYFAAWNFVQKSAGGISIWAIGVTLAMTGFVPNVPQGEETLLGMRLLVSVGPCVLHILALVMMLRFSLDEAAHTSARQRAASRAGAS
jgi:GPH family glycoside/pentoside/hexuronide:cation symporter